MEAILAPESGAAHYHLGKTLLAKGQRQEGQASLRTAIKHPLPAKDRQDAEAALQSG